MNALVIEGGVVARDLAFGYGEASLFEGLGFEIPDGEVHALVGRSGIGKTTLLNILLGLYRPEKGELKVKGRQVAGPGHIRGAVFREDALLGWLTVEDNILFPLHEAPSPVLRAEVSELVAAAGLAGWEQKLPKHLSAGMAKRVELLRAWVSDRHYFVGDEPFSSLDQVTRDTLHNLWRELRTRHPRTGVLCTHDLVEAAMLCDAVMVMHMTFSGIRLTVLRTPVSLAAGGRLEAMAHPFLRRIDELLR